MAMHLIPCFFILMLAIAIWLFVCVVSSQSNLYSPLIPEKVLRIAQAKLASPGTYPQYTDTVFGNWIYFTADTWTSGFFPATLYELDIRAKLCRSTTTPDSTDWVSLGRQWSTALPPLETQNTLGHDVGFVSYPFVYELEVNPTNQTAIDAVNAFATDLAARFSSIVGCTRSWDTTDPTDFTVIIDNMMNLEVLFVSESLTGNHTLRDIAISHADKTMANHIRPDGSSFHVVEYNSTTGDVIRQRTAQGYADSSTWSRGQAWGIYGFANMYKRTQEPRYLDAARRMASYFVTHLPADGIVPWDFNAPLSPPPPADSSAATIVSSALLFLSQLESSSSPANITGAQIWSDAAIRILSDITRLAWPTLPTWQSLLANGTVNMPKNNFLTGIVYGDYYFIKAGNQLVSMKLTRCWQQS